MAISVAVEPVAERVTVLVTLSGLSEAELGRRAGLSRGTVASITAGRNKEPETRTLKLLCGATGAPFAWLADGAGRPPSARRVRAALATALRLKGNGTGKAA